MPKAKKAATEEPETNKTQERTYYQVAMDETVGPFFADEIPFVGFLWNDDDPAIMMNEDIVTHLWDTPTVLKNYMHFICALAAMQDAEYRCRLAMVCCRHAFSHTKEGAAALLKFMKESFPETRGFDLEEKPPS
jgi:hypothetical protein